MHISPCLWFNGRALEAANHYISTFPNSSIKHIGYYDKSNPHGTPWDVMIIVVSLDGNIFHILNGWPIFELSPAVSFIIPCDNQEEVDHYYTNLSAIPEAEQCGWVCDQFGVSWQIVPNRFMELMRSDDTTKVMNLTTAMMKMKRLNIPDLEKAYNGI